MISRICVILNLVLWTSYSEAARILGVWPMPSLSHYSLGHKLLKELSIRGHNVTMISPYNPQENITNFTNIFLDDMVPTINEKFGPEFDFFDLEKISSLEQALIFQRIGTAYNEIALRNRKVQDLLKRTETFDVIIVDMIYGEVLWGLAHHYNCPVIIFSALDGVHLINHLVGNPVPISYVPDIYLRYSSRMSFVERLHNAKHNLIMNLRRHFWQLPGQDEQLHEFFPNAPPLQQLIYNKTALVLMNTHPSILEAKPLVPNMIEIGGFHLNEPKALPKDLQDFMDNATDGVILFSMGSNLKSKNLNNATRSAILRAFAKLKQQIIWKWEDEKLPGKPGNVRIMKWIPQNDIMAHPNLKLFISHGGLLSMTEAINFGIPLLIIPIFADQKMNMAIAAKNQYGIGIYLNELSENTLSAALNEVLNNPKYRNNAKLRSQIFRDRPVKPIDSAVYWIEHVIKHKGAAHLRTAAMDLHWFQLYSIDVALFFIVIAVLVFLAFYHIIKLILGKTKIEDSKKKMK